ncbi:MAG: hypothetical protein ACK50C_04485 [Gemmatimonadaceae bacterium]|jgi:acetyltransferase-like isoleucine patch superfamily enzyme
MMETASGTWQRGARFVWAVVSIILLETVLLGTAMLPVILLLQVALNWNAPPWMRVALLAFAFVPLYLLFAFALLVYSAVATRLLGWRTPEGVELPIADFSWPVLDWGRYLMTIHVVRVFAGPAFRSTTFWSWYMRLNGARLGRLVWVNSLALMDHNLLEFGDGVVIGSDAHVSGHIVERGLLKTARVRLGAGTVIGVGCVIGIGVQSGAGAQVGPLSVVPKFAELEAGASYLGVPVHRIH